MLKELKNYENLGTPKYFWELLNQLENKNVKWTVRNTEEHFFNRIIDGRRIFDGCIAFAISIGIVEINNGFILLDSSFAVCLKNEKYLYNKLLERVFLTLKDDEVFHEIFNSKNISYDIIYHSIQISNSAFRFKYANFKQLLIDFGFLFPHPDQKLFKFIVSSKYKKFFDRNILPGIKNRKIGINELEQRLEEKKIYGEEAENFVMNFEKQRLLGHPSAEEIEKISEYDVSAGYDIISYNNCESAELDRFIEVKSFINRPTFYWSRNEIDTARIKKNAYYLYLVDRNHINKAGFTPIIIQNPYDEILRNDSGWNKRIEKYFISIKDFSNTHSAPCALEE